MRKGIENIHCVPGVRLRPLGQLSIVGRVKLYNFILKFSLKPKVFWWNVFLNLCYNNPYLHKQKGLEMEDSVMMFGVLGLLFCISIFALWIWALVDIISSTFNDVAIKIVWFLLVFFIPFLGFILYVILGKSMKIPKNTTDLNQKYDALERIKKLYDSGALNETEFEAEKQKIMGQN